LNSFDFPIALLYFFECLRCGIRIEQIKHALIVDLQERTKHVDDLAMLILSPFYLLEEVYNCFLRYAHLRVLATGGRGMSLIILAIA
jgi:hypothetical protein